MKELRKIYFKKGREATNVSELISLLYTKENGDYAQETYINEDFIDDNLECEGRRRSFEDLMSIVNTYFEGTTEVELAEALYDNNIAYYHCSEINKIVFHRCGNKNIESKEKDNNYNLNCYKGEKLQEGTYTIEELKEIFKKFTDGLR